jgi:hypothetical protein
LFETLKIVEFFLIIGGKWFELELEFLTSLRQSQSWSRTKKDRLCNTVFDSLVGRGEEWQNFS